MRVEPRIQLLRNPGVWGQTVDFFSTFWVPALFNLPPLYSIICAENPERAFVIQVVFVFILSHTLFLFNTREKAFRQHVVWSQGLVRDNGYVWCKRKLGSASEDAKCVVCAYIYLKAYSYHTHIFCKMCWMAVKLFFLFWAIFEISFFFYISCMTLSTSCHLIMIALKGW